MFQLPHIFLNYTSLQRCSKEAIAEDAGISPDVSRTSLFLSSAHLHHRAYSASNTLQGFFMIQFTGYDPEWPHTNWRWRKTPSASDFSNCSSHSCSASLPGTARGQDGQGGLGRAWDAGWGPRKKEEELMTEELWIILQDQPTK